jgi:Flp pilus assembly protein TadB
MAPLVPPTVVLVLAMVLLALPTVVLVMLALLTVALSPEYVPADTRARRSERQQEQELKTKTQ